MMRPMVLAWPDDPVCCNLDMQYMFGDNILVAPVFNEEGMTQTYLPDENGAWTNLLTGERRAGGRYIVETHDYFSLGLWVKPNSIIATGNDKEVVYDYAKNPTLHVYELTDTACCKLFSGVTGDTEDKLHIHLDRQGNEIKMTSFTAHGGFTLLFRNTQVTAEGLTCETAPEGTKVTVPVGCGSAVFNV
jgi:alpha-D-xyloside xylohydrolase